MDSTEGYTESNNIQKCERRSSATLIDLSSDDFFLDSNGSPIDPIEIDETIKIPLPNLFSRTKRRRSIDYDHLGHKNAKSNGVRSIAGAISRNAKLLQETKEARTPEEEMIIWQQEWRSKLKDGLSVYFDSKNDPRANRVMKMKLDKKRDLLKRKFQSYGAKIIPFIDGNVNLIITRQSNPTILSANKDLKVWDYDKTTRFFQNLETNLSSLQATIGGNSTYSMPKDENVHYFGNSFVYLYDLKQEYAPIIKKEWSPEDLRDMKNLPYPIVRRGTYGRCPFIGDKMIDESSCERIMKRYRRDKIHKKYALNLHALYCHHAQPSLQPFNEKTCTIPHTKLDSKICYEKCKLKHPSSPMKSKHSASFNESILADEKLGVSLLSNENITDIDSSCLSSNNSFSISDSVHDCNPSGIYESNEKVNMTVLDRSKIDAFSLYLDSETKMIPAAMNKDLLRIRHGENWTREQGPIGDYISSEKHTRSMLNEKIYDKIDSLINNLRS
ncbi:hypothetical protein NCAS_0I01450 [Naumovozyma castellii]|uniref:Uncharacterized protein n=1 Tax=Naumovozyma castellii TaxID=27288 RepID=G0VJY1_NAUCA|nr:hypothetical protein NCAS_0I01450 [Naumovozyma castellii CBS 4309]CCC71813.1 hypothetical protein NCAS_0I01450 [Naumovozyma castellii CBS 4309]